MNIVSKSTETVVKDNYSCEMSDSVKFAVACENGAVVKTEFKLNGDLIGICKIEDIDHYIEQSCSGTERRLIVKPSFKTIEDFNNLESHYLVTDRCLFTADGQLINTWINIGYDIYDSYESINRLITLIKESDLLEINNYSIEDSEYSGIDCECDDVCDCEPQSVLASLCVRFKNVKDFESCITKNSYLKSDIIKKIKDIVKF